MKHFSSPPTKDQNKLGRLFLTIPIFATKAGAYPKGVPNIAPL